MVKFMRCAGMASYAKDESIQENCFAFLTISFHFNLNSSGKREEIIDIIE